MHQFNFCHIPIPQPRISADIKYWSEASALFSPKFNFCICQGMEVIGLSCIQGDVNCEQPAWPNDCNWIAGTQLCNSNSKKVGLLCHCDIGSLHPYVIYFCCAQE